MRKASGGAGEDGHYLISIWNLKDNKGPSLDDRLLVLVIFCRGRVGDAGLFSPDAGASEEEAAAAPLPEVRKHFVAPGIVLGPGKVTAEQQA